MFRYLQIQDGEPLPDVGDLKPFKAIVVIENRPSREWRIQASGWLVDSGCLYMMAWGDDCESWDDSVDLASLETFDFGEIPDDETIVTTWHESDSLEEVFRFAKTLAHHPTVKLNNVLILHVGAGGKHARLDAIFQKV